MKYTVVMEYKSLVTLEVEGETIPEAITNAFEAAEDNFEGKWTVLAVNPAEPAVSPPPTYEVSLIHMIELEDGRGYRYMDPRSIEEGQKILFNVHVREYADGGLVDLLEDEDFETWEAADARAVELEQKYPGALRDDY